MVNIDESSKISENGLKPSESCIIQDDSFVPDTKTDKNKPILSNKVGEINENKQNNGILQDSNSDENPEAEKKRTFSTKLSIVLRFVIGLSAFNAVLSFMLESLKTRDYLGKYKSLAAGHSNTFAFLDPNMIMTPLIIIEMLVLVLIVIIHRKTISIVEKRLIYAALCVIPLFNFIGAQILKMLLLELTKTVYVELLVKNPYIFSKFFMYPAFFGLILYILFRNNINGLFPDGSVYYTFEGLNYKIMLYLMVLACVYSAIIYLDVCSVFNIPNSIALDFMLSNKN